MSHDVDTSFGHLGTAAERAGHGLQKGVKHSFKQAGKDAGANFAASVGDGLAAGDVEGLASGAATGVLSAFQAIGGPVGGVFTALGLGAALVFNTMQNNAKASAAAVQTAFDAILNNADAQTRFQTAIAEAGGTAAEALTNVRDMARKAGLPLTDLFKGLTGGQGAAEDLAGSLQKVIDKGTTFGQVAGGRGGGAMVKVYNDSAQAAAELLDLTNKNADATQRAADSAQALADATRDASGFALHLGKRLSPILRSMPAGGRDPDFAKGKRS